MTKITFSEPVFNEPETPPVVLTFAATDPTGGAGLQADILTLSALGCHPLSVVTGITVQDTAGVSGFFPVETELLIDQARTVLEDISVAAFKIGVVSDPDNIAAIAEIISDYPNAFVILDPVLASGRGDDLSTQDTIDALCELLVPQSTLIIPNSIEARKLVADHLDPAKQEELPLCAAKLVELGAESVLITGTHDQTQEVTNRLYDATGLVQQNVWPRFPFSFHGSGCTLSSAIAANLAFGMDLYQAVTEAQEFTWNALSFGFRPGMGQYLLDRFYWAHLLEDDEE